MSDDPVDTYSFLAASASATQAVLDGYVHLLPATIDIDTGRELGKFFESHRMNFMLSGVYPAFRSLTDMKNALYAAHRAGAGCDEVREYLQKIGMIDEKGEPVDDS